MSFAKSPLRRGRNERVADMRFVEVEMPPVAVRPLVVEMRVLDELRLGYVFEGGVVLP